MMVQAADLGHLDYFSVGEGRIASRENVS